MDAITVSACGQREWDWPCLHLEGADVVDLDIGWTGDDGGVYELPDPESDGSSVHLLYRPAEARARQDNTGTLDASVLANRVLVPAFDPSGLSGVYAGAARWTDFDGIVRLTLRCILSVHRDDFGGSDATQAVTLKDLRMFLYDRTADENRLEGAQEFPDRLLYEGLCSAIRQWRETADAYTARVTAQRFPDRNMLIYGACGWALRSYRTLLARNAARLQGQETVEAGRLQAYSAIGAELHRAYSSWLAERIRIDDANDGFAVV